MKILKNLVIRLLNFTSFIKKYWVVERDEIQYKLDISKVIDFAIFARGGWEQNTLRFLKNYLKPGHVVIEVGSNIGAHTLLIGKLVSSSGLVFAIEPTDFAHKRLVENLALNPKIENIQVFKALVSNSSLEVPRLEINADWSLDHLQDSEILVNPLVITIDQLVQNSKVERIDLLKIDVDGYDFKVLCGATNSIARFKPVVFCELCEYALNAQNDSIADIFKLFDSLGYICENEQDGTLLTLNQALDLVGLSTSINGVFRPIKI